MFISGYGNQLGNSTHSLEMPLYSIIIGLKKLSINGSNIKLMLYLQKINKFTFHLREIRQNRFYTYAKVLNFTLLNCFVR